MVQKPMLRVEKAYLHPFIDFKHIRSEGTCDMLGFVQNFKNYTCDMLKIVRIYKHLRTVRDVFDRFFVISVV